MKINRLNNFNTISALIVIGLILCVVRTQWGADVGIILGPGGYVYSAGEMIEPVGNNREIIESDDRVLTIAGRQINSLSEVGDMFRQLDSDPVVDSTNNGARPELAYVPISFERLNYRFTETLTHQDVKDNGLPKSIDAGDKVIGYSNHDVDGDLDRDTIISLLSRHEGAPVTFTFLRPVHQYTADLPLQDPPFPFLPVMMFLLALVAVQGAAWRYRTSNDGLGEVGNDGDPTLRAMWMRFAWTACTLPWALMVLLNPPGAMRDPILLLLSLCALAMFRPLSLDMHQRLRGGHIGHWFVAIAIFVPAVLLALVGGKMVFSLMPSLWDGAISSDADAGIANFLRAASGLIVLYHVMDLGLWFRSRWMRDTEDSEPIPWSGVEIGLLVSSIALGTGLLLLVSSPDDFAVGGFLKHTAGLMLLLWIGDLTLLAWPPDKLERNDTTTGMDLGRSRARIYDFMVGAARHIMVDEVQLVVVHNRLALVMSEADEDEDLGARTLVIERADEPIRAAVGLLRDEQVSLPLPPGQDRGRGEHQGVSSLGDDIAQSVVNTLDVRIAFCLLDEVDELTSPTHEQRERACFVYLIVHGEDGVLGGPEDIQSLRQQFARVWPHSRQLLMEHVLNEASSTSPSERQALSVAQAQKESDATEPGEVLDANSSEGAQQPSEPVVEEPPEAVVPEALEPEELSPEIRELPFLRRDLAMAYPIHELDLLESEIDRSSRDLARNDAPIILVGPAGGGKEFLARRIHALSENARGPFIKFSVSNCPPSLWELEMFGDDDAYGHLTASLGGTLFVEDASLLEDALLDKLLQELAHQSEPIRLILSIRLQPEQNAHTFIASAPSLLGELVRGFLARQVISIPPLHERGELLQRIADYYMMQWSMKHNRVITTMDPGTLTIIREHRWAAGVAELKMLLEAAVLRCDGQTLMPEHLALVPPSLAAPTAEPAPVVVNGIADSTAFEGGLDVEVLARQATNLQEFLKEMQAAVYREALEREQGNKTAAARLMGVKRSTYVRRLKAGDE